MDVTLLLCDYAQEVGGKLYIIGGGWSRVVANQPINNMGLAIKLAVPWGDANRTHEMKLALLNEDGQPVRDPQDNALELSGKVEVGRPPGLKAGTPLDAPVAINVAGVILEPGRYTWQLSVNGKPIADVSFDAVGG